MSNPTSNYSAFADSLSRATEKKDIWSAAKMALDDVQSTTRHPLNPGQVGRVHVVMLCAYSTSCRETLLPDGDEARQLQTLLEKAWTRLRQLTELTNQEQLLFTVFSNARVIPE